MADRPARLLGLALIGCATVVSTSCAAGTQPEGAGTAADPPAGSSVAGPSVAGPSATGGATAAPPSGSVHPVTTVVVSDDPVISAGGQPAADGWPAVLASSLAAAGTPLELAVATADDGGYAGDPPFADLVERAVVDSTQVVVFHETEVGPASADAVGEGAEEAFAAVERRAPDAVVVVVAPWAPGGAPASDDEVHDAVRAAADGAEVSVTYIDPAGEGWGQGATQRQIADRVHEDVADLVAALAHSGAFD
ncbi:hypothetical protein ACI799_12520 [Blastococcus sp. SYSU DS0753]